jgi:hypothetical protein
MDAIKEQSKKPWVVIVGGLLLGLILGLIYAWAINPVEWTDAPIDMLRPELQEEYMRMAIDSYSVNQDVALAQTRYNAVGENKELILTQIQANPGSQSPQSIQAYAAAVQAPPVAAPATTPQPEEAAEGGGGSALRWVLPLLCLIILGAAGVLFYLFYWRNRPQKDAPAASTVSQAPARPAAVTEFTGAGEEPPMVQFMATYKLGDDLFDDSFSIDSPAGEFLGECGVGISETIGVGEPKKVTAFEVWLFDKNDIQTVTKVLMSAHAFLDDATRQRLESKGDPVLAEPGSEIVLETQTLRLVARVVDMAYGDGALPEQSFLERLLLELAVWPKA